MPPDPDGFDHLSWHDCSLHGIALRIGDPAAGDWTAELVLDLDYITESVRGPGGTQFMLAPATLVFHEVRDAKINIDWGNQMLHPVAIDGIEREPDESGQYYLWRVKLNWPTNGEITFGATRFTHWMSSLAAKKACRCLDATTRGSLTCASGCGIIIRIARL